MRKLIRALFGCKHQHIGWPVNGHVQCFDCFQDVPVNWHEPSRPKDVLVETGIERYRREEAEREKREVAELERLIR